jgi:uncharacterized protein YlbG (UPF0298 family)
MELIKATSTDIINGTQLYDSCGNRIELLSCNANVFRNDRRYKYVVEIHYSRDNVQLRSYPDLHSFYIKQKLKFVNVYWKGNQLMRGSSRYSTAKIAEEFGKAGKKGEYWIKAVELT